MYRLLILAAYPPESASTRYRILQFLPLFDAYCIKSDAHYFLSDKQYKDFYNSSAYLQKCWIICIAFARLVLILLKVYNYDVVFISRESINFGPPVFEFMLARLYKIPIVYDIDDALWVKYKSPVIGNFTSFIKPTNKVSEIAKIATYTVVCNEYLNNYIKRFNSNTVIIPTTVDTEKYSHIRSKILIDQHSTALTIGWIGSHSTSKYLGLIYDVIYELGKSYEFIFKVIGANVCISIPGVEVQNIKWSINNEIDELCSFNIGVYPVIKDEWSIGKCAFKAIQYQAAGVACVASPVGMVSNVITHGINGLLAYNMTDWYTNLENLLCDSDLRASIVKAGYKNVKNRYSHLTYAPLLAKVIADTVQSHKSLL